MSRTRRNLSAKFKSELVIELLKGEKDLNITNPEDFLKSRITKVVRRVKFLA